MTTRIELTNEDAELFKLMQRHHDALRALLVADIRNGEAHLFFNNDGVLMDVRIIVNAYHRKKLDKVPT